MRWNTCLVEERIKSYSQCHVTAQILESLDFCWRVTGVYRSPNPSSRIHTWNLLQRLRGIDSLHWFCCGDFNQILHPSEKISAGPVSHFAISTFRDVISEVGLFDLGYSGPMWTWTNKRWSQHCVLERIDRILVDNFLLDHFNNHQVKHLQFFF